PLSPSGRRKGLSERNRPLWMLIPGGALMIIIIVVPLLLGIYMSTLNLDQYTLRKWISSPFIGVENFVEAVGTSPLLHSVWLSVSYSLIAMVVTLPLGIAAAVATQNAFKGRAVVRSIFLIPYVLPAFVVATVWRTMFQPNGIVDKVLGAWGSTRGFGSTARKPSGPWSWYRSGPPGRSSTCSLSRGCRPWITRSTKRPHLMARCGGTSSVM
ncbi:probable ABC transporter permease protein y4oQ, partial [Arthrobacter sp. Hiyo6]